MEIFGPPQRLSISLTLCNMQPSHIRRPDRLTAYEWILKIKSQTKQPLVKVKLSRVMKRGPSLIEKLPCHSGVNVSGGHPREWDNVHI